MAHSPYTVDNLRVQRAPIGFLVQFRAAALTDWHSLRAVSIHNSPAHYLIGDLYAWDLYPAAALVPHILRHEFDPAHPLPDPAPTPDAILTLPDDARAFLVHYMLGAPVNTALARAGFTAEDAPRIIAALSDARIYVVRAAQMRTDLERYERDYRRSLSVEDDARQEYDRAVTADPHAAATLPAPPKPNYGVIERMTEEDYRRIARRKGTVPDGETGNVRWPFRQMQPGDRVVIPAAMAARAQRAAHVYAARTKKRFRTLRDTLTGNLTVYRFDGISANGLEPIKKSLDKIS